MTTRTRTYERSLSCAFCGGIFLAASSKAKYCCGAHRLAAKRKADRLANEMTGIRAELDGFANEFIVNNRSTRQEALTELGALKLHLDRFLVAWESWCPTD